MGGFKSWASCLKEDNRLVPFFDCNCFRVELQSRRIFTPELFFKSPHSSLWSFENEIYEKFSAFPRKAFLREIMTKNSISEKLRKKLRCHIILRVESSEIQRHLNREIIFDVNIFLHRKRREFLAWNFLVIVGEKFVFCFSEKKSSWLIAMLAGRYACDFDC